MQLGGALVVVGTLFVPAERARRKLIIIVSRHGVWRLRRPLRLVQGLKLSGKKRVERGKRGPSRRAQRKLEMEHSR